MNKRLVKRLTNPRLATLAGLTLLALMIAQIADAQEILVCWCCCCCAFVGMPGPAAEARCGGEVPSRCVEMPRAPADIAG